MNNTAETIGFIGVGLMGHGIAKNLLIAGYSVYLLAHRNRAPIDDLLSKGAKEVKTLADMARNTTVIQICAIQMAIITDVVINVYKNIQKYFLIQMVG